VYREPISRWIIGMKFAGQWPWAKWFGRRLARAAGRSAKAQQRVVVCPVPLHWARRLRRGYDQSYLMAHGFAQVRGWPVVRLIRKARYTRPQTALSASRRVANVRGSFKVKPLDLTGWTVWLVDDVKTTGATLSVCARLLRKAGADRIHVAVAAVADPAGTDFKTWPGGSAT
jgi:ComF family protein